MYLARKLLTGAGFGAAAAIIAAPGLSYAADINVHVSPKFATINSDCVKGGTAIVTIGDISLNVTIAAAGGNGGAGGTGGPGGTGGVGGTGGDGVGGPATAGPTPSAEPTPTNGPNTFSAGARTGGATVNDPGAGIGGGATGGAGTGGNANGGSANGGAGGAGGAGGSVTVDIGDINFSVTNNITVNVRCNPGGGKGGQVAIKVPRGGADAGEGSAVNPNMTQLAGGGAMLAVAAVGGVVMMRRRAGFKD